MLRQVIIFHRGEHKLVHRHTNLFQEYDIRFYERPDKVHAKELQYSGGDIREFKVAKLAQRVKPKQCFKDAITF